MFATMKPYAPPPPAGAQPPPLWGSETHLGELFGARVSDVAVRRQSVRVEFGADGFLSYFKRNYGPTISIYRFIADDPERVAALDADLNALARRFDVSADGSAASGAMDWEYLLYTAKRAA
jgi:hypothetical protein